MKLDKTRPWGSTNWKSRLFFLVSCLGVGSLTVLYVSQVNIKNHFAIVKPSSKLHLKPISVPLLPKIISDYDSETMSLPAGTDIEGIYVHVVFSTDNRTIPGLLAAMRSVIVNTAQPERLRFYLIAAPLEKALMTSHVHCMLTQYIHPKLDMKLEQAIHSYIVVEFNIWEYEPNWEIKYREVPAEGKADRSSPNNYVRLYLHRLLRRTELVGKPLPNKVIYFDTDVIVQGDVCDVYDKALVDNKYAVALSRRSMTLRDYTIDFDHPVLAQWNQVHKGTASEISPEWIAYNNGVCVIHLGRWEAYNLTEAVNFWVKANLEQQLFQFSFNPPFLLGILNRVEILPESWNIARLGIDKRIKRKDLAEGNVLHWTGKMKGWKKYGFYTYIWNSYGCDKCTASFTGSY